MCQTHFSIDFFHFNRACSNKHRILESNTFINQLPFSASPTRCVPYWFFHTNYVGRKTCTVSWICHWSTNDTFKWHYTFAYEIIARHFYSPTVILTVGTSLPQNVCHIEYIWNLAHCCPECCAIFSILLQIIKSSEYVTFLPPIMGVTFFSHIARVTFFGCHQKNVRLDSIGAPRWIDVNINIIGKMYVMSRDLSHSSATFTA